METILIAGGTGLIGKRLSAYWKTAGHEVRLLTRGASDPENGIFHWNAMKGKLDEQAMKGVTVLVNLSGAGIGDKRWTAKRQKELFDSRIQTTRCLWRYAEKLPTLKQYISASGAVCYGFDDHDKIYVETDPFGSDLLSRLTKEWEAAADSFRRKCNVAKLRTGIVLAPEGGALPVIAKPIRKGLGTILGSGKQAIPWIHIEDIVRAYDWAMTHGLDGAYHATAGNTDNVTMTRTLAKIFRKRVWLPKAPAWALRLVLGTMSEIVLKGNKVDNTKLLSTGFELNHDQLEEALKHIYS
jgi:uncharacterized protein (TIGR01777 family)